MNKENLELDHEHDENCGHNHDEDMEIITLDLNDGSQLECEVMGIFEVEDKEYMALISIDDGEVLLFAYSEDEEAFELTAIEDEDEFDLVVEAYYTLFGEDFEEFDTDDFDDEGYDFDE